MADPIGHPTPHIVIPLAGCVGLFLLVAIFFQLLFLFHDIRSRNLSAKFASRSTPSDLSFLPEFVQRKISEMDFGKGQVLWIDGVLRFGKDDQKVIIVSLALCAFVDTILVFAAVMITDFYIFLLTPFFFLGLAIPVGIFRYAIIELYKFKYNPFAIIQVVTSESKVFLIHVKKSMLIKNINYIHLDSGITLQIDPFRKQVEFKGEYTKTAKCTYKLEINDNRCIPIIEDMVSVPPGATPKANKTGEHKEDAKHADQKLSIENAHIALSTENAHIALSTEHTVVINMTLMRCPTPPTLTPHNTIID